MKTNNYKPYSKVFIVIPNLNGLNKLGKTELKKCLDAVKNQTYPNTLVFVDNGSKDGSSEFVQKKFPQIKVIQLDYNHGFAGGVNAGIRFAIKEKADYIVLLNNDAIVDKNWLKELLTATDNTKGNIGIVTSKFLQQHKQDGKYKIDSTGDEYSVWGLPYPRGRNELDTGQYDSDTTIFGASGGASLYSAKMLEDIGLFDERFFAYFEDVDISFRAQLAGYKVTYQPKAVAYHGLSKTSSTMPGFAHYHTLKNLYPVYLKNMPTKLYWVNILKFSYTFWRQYIKAISERQFLPAIKALIHTFIFFPRNIIKRIEIQHNKKVDSEYINSILLQNPTPNGGKWAHKLYNRKHR